MIDQNIEEFDKSIESLRKNWRSLSGKLELKTSVPVKQRHRIVSCSKDIIGFADTLKNTFNEKYKLDLENYNETIGKSITELSEHWKSHHKESMYHLDQLSSVVKAMYYFIRSLQDAGCSILFELNGMSAGSYTSMYGKVLKKPESDLFKEINTAIPGYFNWFQEFKRTRDRIKLGITQGGSFSPFDGVHLNFHMVIENEQEASVDIDEKIGMENIVNAIQMSNALLNHIESKIKN